MKTVSYTLRIPEDLMAELDEAVARLGISRAQVVIERLKSEPQRECRSIYLMKKGSLHKIGMSYDPPTRRKAVGADVELIWHERIGCAQALEQGLHAHFAEKRKHGEWFELTPDDIEWIKRLDMYHPCVEGFTSNTVSCKCHPPRFTEGRNWTSHTMSWKRIERIGEQPAPAEKPVKVETHPVRAVSTPREVVAIQIEQQPMCTYTEYDTETGETYGCSLPPGHKSKHRRGATK